MFAISESISLARALCVAFVLVLWESSHIKKLFLLGLRENCAPGAELCRWLCLALFCCKVSPSPRVDGCDPITVKHVIRPYIWNHLLPKNGFGESLAFCKPFCSYIYLVSSCALRELTGHLGTQYQRSGWQEGRHVGVLVYGLGWHTYIQECLRERPYRAALLQSWISFEKS